MAYRIPGGRVTLDLDGPSIEVEQLVSPTVGFLVRAELAAFLEAKDEAGRIAALGPICERFVVEAQPTWEIVDHRGPILPTVAGMLRLDPLRIVLPAVMAWVETMPVADEDAPATAVDALIPPGPLNASLNQQLAEAKRRRKVA